MATARWIWADMSGVESSKSIAEYFRLRQVEAAGHIKDLEQALEKIRELEQERADLWHQAAHDLRGNLGVVKTATAVLSKMGASQPGQKRFLRLLDRNVASHHHLLDDVMGLAGAQIQVSRSSALGSLLVSVRWPTGQNRRTTSGEEWPIEEEDKEEIVALDTEREPR
jgi:light-regulated signal transduction histidine kinase (bacteriophytochrome)